MSQHDSSEFHDPLRHGQQRGGDFNVNPDDVVRRVENALGPQTDEGALSRAAWADRLRQRAADTTATNSLGNAFRRRREAAASVDLANTTLNEIEVGAIEGPEGDVLRQLQALADDPGFSRNAEAQARENELADMRRDSIARDAEMHLRDPEVRRAAITGALNDIWERSGGQEPSEGAQDDPK